MALPDWTNGNGTNIWSDGANWSTAVKPQAGDTVTFTNTSVANCTVDEVTAEIASLTIGGTSSGVYSGTITGSNKIQMTGNMVIEDGCTGTFDMNADIDIDGDFTGDGVGVTVLCGSGTWTCDGNFDNKDIGTWTAETSTVVLTTTNSFSVCLDMSRCIVHVGMRKGNAIPDNCSGPASVRWLGAWGSFTGLAVTLNMPYCIVSCAMRERLGLTV